MTVAADKAVIAVSKMVIRNNQLYLVQLGTILKIVTRDSIVVAMVSSLKVGAADAEGLSDGCLAQLDILGEITTNATTRATKFFRGVRTFPVLNEPVYNMSAVELEMIFNKENDPVYLLAVCSRIIPSLPRFELTTYFLNTFQSSALQGQVNHVPWH